MKGINMVGQSFESLTQRVVYAYKCTYPDLTIKDSKAAGEKSQRQLHAWFGDIINNIYENPAFLMSKLEPDEYFENYVLCNTNPDLVTRMKMIERKLFEYYKLLYSIGELSEAGDHNFCLKKEQLVLSSAKLKHLHELGLESEKAPDAVIFTNPKYPDCFPAWKLLTQVCNPDYSDDSPELLWFMFMHCIFDKNHITESKIYGDVMKDSSGLENMENFLRNRGYTVTFKDNRLRFIKEYPKKQIGYLSVEFAYRRKYQICIEFHLPNCTALIQSYDSLSPQLKDFVFHRLKTCDGCGYCTQTDKTGKRKPLHMMLACGSKELLKCPLYPFFSFGELDQTSTDCMKELITLAEMK